MTSRSIGAGSDRGAGPLARQLRTLFAAGSFAGLADGELLDRFLDRGRSRPLADAEAAFAALVDRHGPMVRRSCRAILGNAADADDAFQGVFLLLARKARSLRSRETVAPWLLETCRRVCRKLLVSASRRRSHEARASLPADAPTTDLDPASLDDRAVLLDEIDRLPPSFRAPILLCGLEGRTAAEASRLLGVAEGTIHSRLSRARALLRSRLSRRGLAFVPLPIPRLSPFLPERLVTATVRNASLLSAGRLAAIEAPAVVLSLIVSTSRRTLMHSTLLLSLVSAASLGPLAAGWAPSGPPDDPANAPVALSSPAVEHDDMEETIHVRLVEKDGSPSPDATVLVRGGTGELEEFRPDTSGLVVLPGRLAGMSMIADRPQTDAVNSDGKPRPRAIGFHGDFGRPNDGGSADQPIEITLQPVGPPVRIRVEDEDGAPIPGARGMVRSLSDQAVPGTGLGLRSLTAIAYAKPEESTRLFGELVADAEGVIHLAVPEGAWATLNVSGHHLAGPSVSVRSGTSTSPKVVLQPAGGITGRVTDSETGRPVPGVWVRSTFADHGSNYLENSWPLGVTGTDGRFHLPDARPGVYHVQLVRDPSDARQAPEVVGVRVEAGQDSTANLTLMPARRVSGRVVLADDDSPLRGVMIRFCRTDGNGVNWGDRTATTGLDGRFSVGLLPGSYSVTPMRSEYRLLAVDDQLIVAPFELTVTGNRDPDPLQFTCERRESHPTPSIVRLNRPTSLAMSSLAYTVEVAAEITRQLSKAYWGAHTGSRVLQGRVLDEEGAPVAGVRIWSLSPEERAEVTRIGNVHGIVIDGRSATTDQNGRYILEGQTDGPLNLGLYRIPAGIRYETVAAGVAEADFVLPLRR